MKQYSILRMCCHGNERITIFIYSLYELSTKRIFVAKIPKFVLVLSVAIVTLCILRMHIQRVLGFKIYFQVATVKD